MSLDFWLEMFDTLRRNKLRSALTALSVAWGIFMLVILLGSGRGLEHGVRARFADDAINSIWLFPGQTSLPHEGHPVGSAVRLNNADVARVAADPAIDHITGRFFLPGEAHVSYGAKSSGFEVRATHPAHQYLEKTLMVEGRFLNDLDQREHRKVTAIGVPVAKFFFGDEPALGKWLRVSGVAFQVVGIFTDAGGAGETEKLYLPIATAQIAYGGNDRVNQLMFTVGDADVAESHVIADRVRDTLAETHHFSPDDKKAVRIRNNVEQFQTFMSMFDAIRIFVWFVGVGTILAGIVGVSNIMLIAVKERTKEIGIRKALGATPFSIVSHIVAEAIVVTSLAGYLGMIAGIWTLDVLARNIPDNDVFANPTVDLRVAMTATGILVAAGALAGYFPARSAAKVNPVIALRDG